MQNRARLLPLLLATAPACAAAGSLGAVVAHVDGSVSLADLLGGPAITDSFSFDGPPASLPLAGDAFADSIIPSTATVQAVVEADALSIASETNNISGVEPATTSASATLSAEIEAGQWLLTATTEHVALFLGPALTVEVQIAYTVTSAAGALVDETLTFTGPADSFETVGHTFSVEAGDTATLAASITADTTSPVFGNALALSVVDFDLTAAVDGDGDGVVDDEDNCTQAANPGQEDSNGDGIGNACDADLTNDCIVGFADLAGIKQVFYTADADADFNSDGVVNFSDLAVMKIGFFQPPGPSGIPNACD